jgi:predicted metal-binding protein
MIHLKPAIVMESQNRGANPMGLNTKQRKQIEDILKLNDYINYKWIDPKKIIVSQWVRMKCKFGCGEYGRGGTCPPETPSVAECKEFFNEYGDAVILHFEGLMDKPEDRHAWSAKINAKLVQLERAVFSAGFERAFQLFMDSCSFCKDCTGSRETCEKPRMARPAPEAMAVDVYSTVRRAGFTINVLSDYDQKMDRFAFLMVH